MSVGWIDLGHRRLGSSGRLPVGEPVSQMVIGIRLAVCVDPDGLGISFAQPIAQEATGPA